MSLGVEGIPEPSPREEHSFSHKIPASGSPYRPEGQVAREYTYAIAAAEARAAPAAPAPPWGQAEEEKYFMGFFGILVFVGLPIAQSFITISNIKDKRGKTGRIVMIAVTSFVLYIFGIISLSVSIKNEKVIMGIVIFSFVSSIISFSIISGFYKK